MINMERGVMSQKRMKMRRSSLSLSRHKFRQAFKKSGVGIGRAQPRIMTIIITVIILALRTIPVSEAVTRNNTCNGNTENYKNDDGNKNYQHQQRRQPTIV